MTRTRRRKRKKLSKLNKALFVGFVIALIGLIIVTFLSYEEDDVYRNENQFKKFVEYNNSSDVLNETIVTNRTDITYGEPVSVSVNYSRCRDPRVEIFRDDKIEEIKNSYNESIPDDDERVRALLIRSGVYDSSNGARSLLIYEKSSIENSGKMNKGHSYLNTYHFSEKTGDLLVPQQVFYEGYKYYCQEYFSDFFISNYGEELAEGWEEYIKPTEDNYNNYIVDDKGVTFFFEEGTILDESAGVVYAGLTDHQAASILRDEIIERYIVADKPMVALTYDDGPGLESEDRILDCLEDNNAVATFFYQGVFIKGREAKIKRAADMGCEIGNHTWSHPVLTSLKSSDVKKQFDKTNDAIFNACGEYPTVFRPSYGETDGNINKMSGMPVIMWSIDTLDWESRNGKKVYNVIKSSKNLDGSIILMHSIHSSTADATELIVPWLKENGYQLVTVSELIKYKTGKDPVAGKVYRTYK